MNRKPPPAAHLGAESVIYHLALALVRSGSFNPSELIPAAKRVEDEGNRTKPGDDTWRKYGALQGSRR